MNDKLKLLPFNVISPPILEIMQILTLKIQGQGHGCGERERSQLVQLPSYLLPFCFTSITPTIPEIELLQNLTLKTSRSRSCEVKGRGHIVDPESNQRTPFLFHVNRTNHSWYGQKCLTFTLEILTKKNADKNPPEFNQMISMTRRI